MAQSDTVRIHLADPAATEALGRRLAPFLEEGDTILLDGPIGAGKSHFARALIQERLSRAGLAEDVPSPTFTVLQEYFDGRVRIVHADLFRLSGPSDVMETGLDSIFGEAISLVEWPDRLGGLAPQDSLWVGIEPARRGAGRDFTITGGPRWSDVIANLDRTRPETDA